LATTDIIFSRNLGNRVSASRKSHDISASSRDHEIDRLRFKARQQGKLPNGFLVFPSIASSRDGLIASGMDVWRAARNIARGSTRNLI
jgi:hypothetical protein